MPKKTEDMPVAELARQHTVTALAALVRVLSPERIVADKDLIAAANSILEWGHGKPMQAMLQMNTNADSIEAFVKHVYDVHAEINGQNAPAIDADSPTNGTA